MNNAIVAFGMLIAVTSVLQAQPSVALKNPAGDRVSSDDTRIDQPCSYDGCALRLTLNFGSWRIVRGVEGTPIGSLGIFTAPDLVPMFSGVPPAADEVRPFRRLYTRSAALIWGGAAVLFGGAVVSASQGGSAAANTVGLAGLATLAYGGWRHGKSVDVLSRAIWLYNRSLPR